MDQGRKYRVFLSAVSNEFGQARDVLGKYLIRHDQDPVWQDVFPDHGDAATLQRALFDLVAGCDAVICLHGRRSGSYPPAEVARALAADPPVGTPVTLPEGFDEASRTQWEYFFARSLGKPIRLFRPNKEFQPEQAVPDGADFPDRQQAFLAYLDREDPRWAGFRSADHLCAEAALIRWEFSPQRMSYKPIHPEFHSIGALFTGRDDFLDRIRASLTRADGNAAAIVSTVHGMGGIGKTRAAIEYAVRYQNDYRALLFVRASDKDALERNLVGLAGVLRLPEAEAAEDAVKRAAVQRWLDTHPGWLLVLDNVDTPDMAREATVLTHALRGGHILLTSRLEAEFEHGIATLELGLLSREDAVAYLLKATEGRRRPEPDAAARAQELADALDRLTLGLVHAAAYIAERRITFAAYAREWGANRDKVLGWARPEVTGYPLSLAQTWLTSMQQLTPAGRALLERLSFFGNDPVPEFLLDVAVPPAETAEGLDPLLDLQRFSLVARDPEVARFTVHRIVRDVTNRRLATEPATSRTRLAEAACWLDAAFTGDPGDVRSWPRLDPLAPHAEALAWAADNAGIADPTARLMGELGVLFDAKAEHARAERFSRPALAIDAARFGDDHPTVAIRLNNLALLLRATNRLGEAEPLMRRALAIDEKSFGDDHPEVATDLNNLALLLRATNRLGEAEPLMRRALAIDEKSFGDDHPEVATDLNNLAELLQATNRLGEAEPLMRRALAIDERSFGDDHPTVAIRLNNLAQLLQDTNRLGEAEPLIRRALAIDETSFGDDHPNVATRLNNLAQLLQDTNRLGEAEPLMRRALAIDEKSFGDDHPRVAIRLNNLAQLLQATNRLGEAEPLMRRALAIDEKSLGDDHPDVALDLNNLAQLLQDTNRLGEAEPLMRRMVTIFLAFQRDTGHAHPHRDVALQNYASLLEALGHDEAAIRAAIESASHEAGLG